LGCEILDLRTYDRFWAVCAATPTFLLRKGATLNFAANDGFKRVQISKRTKTFALPSYKNTASFLQRGAQLVRYETTLSLTRI